MPLFINYHIILYNKGNTNTCWQVMNGDRVLMLYKEYIDDEENLCFYNDKIQTIICIKIKYIFLYYVIHIL